MSRLIDFTEPPTTRPEASQSPANDSRGDSVVKLPHTVSFGSRRESTVSFATAASKHDGSNRRGVQRTLFAQPKSDRGSRAPEPVDDDPASISGSSLTEETDATSASSAQRASREAGMTIFRVCGIKIAIPFTAWTFLAMSVPILFLIIVVARPLAAATSQLDKIQQLAPMAEYSSRCMTEISRERVSVVLFLRGNADTDALKFEQSTADIACMEWVGVLQRLASEDVYFITSFQQSVLHANKVAAIRQRVEDWVELQNATHGSISSGDISSLLDDVTNVYDAAAKATSEAVTLAADKIQTDATRLFIGYKLVSDLRLATYAYVADACSLADSGTHLSTASNYRIFASHAALNAARDSVRASAPDVVVSQMQVWWTSDAMTTLRDTVAPALQGETVRLEYADAQELSVNAIALLLEMEYGQIKRLTDADDLKATVVENALLAAFSITACLVSAGLLAWQQMRVQAQLESQVANVERTRRAVSAFVPRFFLAKMGYTSITQVRVGESTNVALAMLFADVRRFTTVSEGMSCDALFNWVQEYFRRMTLVVDSRNGNINQFIGDGLFAVFSSARDSVRCAIDMQSDVQQLNVERLCEQGNDVPIEIGVGLHHDVLAMGILGDERRHTCTAISASVNLASRLDGLTKQLGCRILASQAVIDQLPPNDLESVHHRRVGAVRVKGSALNTVVYDIFQSDERAVQKYKRETKAAFEEFTTQAVLIEDAAMVDAAADKLRAAAAVLEVTDRAINEILRCRDVAASAFVFDLK
jgi:class 3 adenylate cyclase/plasmid maintenance system antidote protein VapI